MALSVQALTAKNNASSKKASSSLEQLAAQTGGTINTRKNRVEYTVRGNGTKSTRVVYAGETPNLTPHARETDTASDPLNKAAGRAVRSGVAIPDITSFSGTVAPEESVNSFEDPINSVVPTQVQNRINGTSNTGIGSSALSPINPGAIATAPEQSKYAAALSAAQASGAPAPSDAGQARMAAQAYTPANQPDTSGSDAFLSQDPMVSALMQGVSQLLNPVQQTTTLLADYKKLYRQSGLDEINEELIDADTIIEGTESDIRNEIQGAGGFGTESQVQAMSLARNKGLLKRYNQLVQMKTDATNQLNTMMQLNQQDKQMAQQRIDTQINTMFKLADFRQQAQRNTQEAFNNMVAKVGYAGAYQAYSSDPARLAQIEQTMGLNPGGLQKLSLQRDLDREAKEASIRASNASAANANRRDTQVVDVGGRKFLIDSQTGQQISEIAGGATDNAGGLARSQENINSVSNLVKDPYLKGAVGPNALARLSPLSVVTGGKNNFISGIEQLRQQLTLDALQNAKANGATFGALSEGELDLLSKSSSKLGTWAVKNKEGQITGYNTNTAEFKKELDKINNFSKLDYLKKGGDPSSVGVVQQPDGSYWTQNSDGSYTKIY